MAERKILTVYTALSLILMSANSCKIDERYNINDIKDINTDMTLFSEGLEIPIGSTAPIPADSLVNMLDSASRKLIEKNGDSYVIRTTGDLSLDDQINTIDISNLKSVDGIKAVEKFGISLITGIPEGGIPVIYGDYSAPFSIEDEIVVVKAHDLPNEIKYVKELTLKDAFATVEATFDGLPFSSGGNENYTVDVVISLPEFITPSEIHVKGRVEKDGRLSFDDGTFRKTIRMERISDLDLSKGTDITGTIRINGILSASLAGTQNVSIPQTIDGTISVSLGNSNGSIEIEKVVGRTEFATPAHYSIGFDDLPEELKGDDIVLDLAAPQILVDITTNTGIPVNGSVTITPWRNGHQLDDMALTLNNLSLPCSASAGTVSRSCLYISNDDSAVPSGEYSFIQANTAQLLRQIPDSLVIDMNAGVSGDTDCIVEPFAEYKGKVDYVIQIPLETGRDLNLRFNADFDLELGEITANVTEIALGITGKVRNDTPLILEAGLSVLDKDGRLIELGNDAKPLLIGAEGESDIDFYVELPSVERIKEITKGRIAMTVRSVGGPIRPSQSIRLYDLKAHLPKGVSLKFQE